MLLVNTINVIKIWRVFMKRYLNMFILLLLPLLVSAKSVDTNQFGYGGTYNETFNSVEKTIDGGYIVVGSTKSKKINEVSTGVGNGLVVKYDKDGNVEWDKFYGGNGHEEFYDSHGKKIKERYNLIFRLKYIFKNFRKTSN